jgi:hypothetical protein
VPGTTLVRTTLTGVRPLGVRGEPLHHAQAQIRAVVRRRLGDRAFHLLAEPQPHDLGGRIDWYSELSGPVRPLADLPVPERDAVRADIDVLLADIDRLGESLEAGPTDDGRLAGRSLRLAAKRPADDHLFLIGDQPVVVCWGYDTDAAGAVLPGAFLPSATAAAPPPAPPPVMAPPIAVGPAGAAALARDRFPWLFWLLAGLLAIVLLLLAAWALRHIMPVPPDLRLTEQTAPPAPPPGPPPDPTIGLKGDLDSARDEEGRLKVTLASLRDDLEGKLRQCQPPEPPKPPQPPVVERKPDPPPAPKPEPKPKVVERKPEPPPKPPDGRMRMPTAPTNDYSFLQGCWRTDSFKHGPRIPPGYATYCFDNNGRGSMVFRFNDGTTCRAPATARFAGGTLRVVDADSTCSPQGQWAQDRLDCTAGADGVAVCRGENRTERWTVNLHRVGG